VFRWLRLVLGVLVVLMLMVWVWPSLYRWDHMTVDGDVYPVRIHRITGHADILMPEQGWVPAEEPWDSTGDTPETSRS